VFLSATRTTRNRDEEGGASGVNAVLMTSNQICRECKCGVDPGANPLLGAVPFLGLVTMPAMPDEKPTLGYVPLGRRKRRFPMRLFIASVIIWVLLIFGLWGLAVAIGARTPGMAVELNFLFWSIILSVVYLPIAIFVLIIWWAISRQQP
jgi:hypothetical protein